MHRSARVLEGYVPALNSTPRLWSGEALGSIAALLPESGLAGWAIVLPQDEMVIVVAWSGDFAEGPPDATGLSEAISRAIPGLIVQRTIVGHLVDLFAEEERS